MAWLHALGGPVTVAMEAALYWAWLQEPLSAVGIGAVAAHPYQGKPIWPARRKTDPIDTRKLADLLRTKLLPVIWVPDAGVQAHRKLRRGRAYLVRRRTGVKNRDPRAPDGGELSHRGDGSVGDRGAGVAADG